MSGHMKDPLFVDPLTPEPMDDAHVAREETRALIAADKVAGTAVYDRAGTKLGTIDTVMIDKVGGEVEYAVMSFGGFLGIGQNHYPVPWDQLRYDTTLGGYVVDITEDQVRGAPSYADSDVVDWNDTAFNDRLRDYYGGVPAII